MAAPANPQPTPVAPTTVSPKVTAAAAVGIGLVALQAILTVLTPEMFDFAGDWSPLLYSLVTAVGAALAGYLKTDPARFTTHHTDPNLRADGGGRHRA